MKLDTERRAIWRNGVGAGVRRQATEQLTFLLAFVALLWLVEIADWVLFGGRLDALGIRPRTWIGLRNVLFAPFLHAGFGHLLANTLPFIVLGWLVLLRGSRDFWVATLAAGLAGGLGIWLFGGATTLHLGLSGIVFGYFGFLLARAYFERSASAALLAVIALLFYGGLLWGLLPGRPGISWLGHSFGFLGGVAAAWWFTPRRAALPANGTPLR